MIGYLDCPECGDPCTTIPGERSNDPRQPWDVWNEDMEGACQCGALVTVSVDDGCATLKLKFDPEAGDIVPAGQTPLPFVQVGMIVRTPEVPSVDLLVTSLVEAEVGVRRESVLQATLRSFDGKKALTGDSRHIRATCTVAVPFVSSETFTGRWAAAGVAEVDRG